MQTKYFNIQTMQGVETVDQLNQSDFKNFSEFRKEYIRLKKEYQIAGMPVYLSQRCTNEWKN